VADPRFTARALQVLEGEHDTLGRVVDIEELRVGSPVPT
jgi:hypothetical protein